MRGRIVAIEGLDGVGKTTLARSLAGVLGAAHLTTPSERLRAVRATVDDVFAVHPIAAQLFYAASVVHASAEAARHVALGRDVVIDRYWISTLVHAPQRGRHLELAEVERELAPADVTLLLDLNDDERARRLTARGLSPHDRASLVPAAAHALRSRFRDLLRHPIAGRGVELDVRGAAPDAVLAMALAELPRLAARPARPAAAPPLRAARGAR